MLSTNDLRINVASRTSKRTIKINVAAGHYLINSGFFEQHISAGPPSFFVLDVPQIPQKCRVRRLRKGQPLVDQGIAPRSFPATAIFPRFACILSAWIKRSATDFAKTRSPLSSPSLRGYASPAPAYSLGRAGPMQPCKWPSARPAERGDGYRYKPSSYPDRLRSTGARRLGLHGFPRRMTEIRTVSTLIAKRDEIERSIANYEVRLARLEKTLN